MGTFWGEPGKQVSGGADVCDTPHHHPADLVACVFLNERMNEARSLLMALRPFQRQAVWLVGALF